MLGLVEYKHALSLEHGHHLFVAERSIGFCFFEHKDKILNFVCKHHMRDKAAKLRAVGRGPFLAIIYAWPETTKPLEPQLM